MDWNESIALTGKVKAKTDMAILFVEEEDTTEVWLPRSQITTDDELTVGAEVEIEIPRWLAEDKNLA